MKVSLVVAMTPERVIGRDGTLPWRLPADLRHFKRLTLGHAVIMGRRTFESIGKPLTGRTNIVLSRQGFVALGCVVVRSVDAALAAAQTAMTETRDARPAAGDAASAPPPANATRDQIVPDPDEIMVIGGGEIYALFLPLAQKLYVTWVHEEIDGNTRFPALDTALWNEAQRIEQPADERNPVRMSFSLFVRRAAPLAES